MIISLSTCVPSPHLHEPPLQLPHMLHVGVVELLAPPVIQQGTQQLHDASAHTCPAPGHQGARQRALISQNSGCQVQATSPA
jgi:hypothetical protein